VDHERLAAVEALHQQAGDVAVAPVLAEQGDGVPEHQVGLLRPGERGVPGEERAALRRAGDRRRPCQVGGLGDLGASHHVVSEDGPERPVGSPQPGRHELPPVGATSQAPPSALRTSPGSKLKNVACTTSALTAPIGAARLAK
jgi:hypothetical protein